MLQKYEADAAKIVFLRHRHWALIAPSLALKRTLNE